MSESKNIKTFARVSKTWEKWYGKTKISYKFEFECRHSTLAPIFQGAGPTNVHHRALKKHRAIAVFRQLLRGSVLSPRCCFCALYWMWRWTSRMTYKKILKLEYKMSILCLVTITTNMKTCGGIILLRNIWSDMQMRICWCIMAFDHVMHTNRHSYK